MNYLIQMILNLYGIILGYSIKNMIVKKNGDDEGTGDDEYSIYGIKCK